MKTFLDKPFHKMTPKHYMNMMSWLHTGIVLAIFAAFICNFKVAEVPTLSMYPTLDRGEVVFCQLTKKVDYGDIALFYPNTESTTKYIKRVIGKAGDTISVHDGAVWRNGEKLDEPYLNEAIEYTMDEVTVPDGSYFMMGDNRNHSLDSHIIGSIPEAQFYAKALFHFNLFSVLHIHLPIQQIVD